MITIYNSNLDFDLDSSNSITLSSTSNMVFKTNGSDKLTIQNNGISVSGNVVVSGLITSTGAGFSGIGAGLSNIPISAINELRLELNGGTTELSVTRDTLNASIVSEARFGSNYTGRINSELNTRVDNTSNYVFATSNILIGRIINTSNYVDSTSNFLSVRIDNTSNYAQATSNILIGRIINTSNYVDSTSNFLGGRIDNTSNYALATSNILIGRIINTSNYVESTSNTLIGRLINTSNYVDSTSNFLSGRIDNTSNYALATSNILIGRIINTSNYVDSTSNILIGRIINTSNYVESTSNILIGRIINTSNYVDSTSNILIGRIINTSNYVESTSNTLIGRIINTSNYVDSTSNFLARRIDNASSWGSNYTDKADIWGSNYSDKVGGWGSNYAYDKVGVWSSNYAYDKVGVWGSNYSDKVGVWGSNYAYDKVGIWSSNYADRVGVWGSNYAYDKVGVWSSNYTDRVGGWGSNYAYDKVGMYSSNYADRVGERTSNYVLATSNILIGRIINTSNYVSSYKPLTAVTADFANRFTNSVNIAGVPFNGTANISISYNALDNQLSFGNGLSTSYDNITKITSVTANAAPQEQSDWTQTSTSSASFIKNKPTIPSNTFQLNGSIAFYNSGNVGIGTNAPLSLLEIITANYTGALLTLDAGVINSTTQMPRSIGRPLLKLGKTSYSTSAGDYYGIGFGISPTLSDYNCAEIGTIITSTTGLETGDIIFSTRPGTNNVIATERMRITSAGNVGIGTNTGINNIFQVGSGGRLRIANNTYDWSMIGTNDTNGTTNTRIVISGTDRGVFNGNIEYVTTSTGSHMFLSDGSTERMRIANNGNVGIGTTDTATYKLNVAGDINISSGSSFRVGGATLSTFTPSSTNLIGSFLNTQFENVSSAIQIKSTWKPTTAGTADAVPYSGITSIPATWADSQIPSLATSKITSGTFADSFIPSLATSKITSGTFADSFIPSLGISKTSGLQTALDAKQATLTSSSTLSIGSLTTTENVGVGTTPSSYKLHIKSSRDNPASGLHIDTSDNTDPNRYSLTIYPYTIASDQVGYKFRIQNVNGGTWTPITIENNGVVRTGGGFYSTYEIVSGTNIRCGTEFIVPFGKGIRDTANMLRFTAGGLDAPDSNNQDVNHTVIRGAGNKSIVFQNAGGTEIGYLNNGGTFYSTAGGSSDIRIKKEILDINDDSALQMILAIEPKTYKYIDDEIEVARVYGFIGQQLRSVIPEATEIQIGLLPNIMKNAVCDKNKVYLDLTGYTDVPLNDDTMKVNINYNNRGDNYKIIEVNKDYFVIDKELYYETIDNGNPIKTPLTNVFVRGYEVNDFHKIKKDYVFTLNVCATQELHRLISAQQIIIKSYEERIKELERKMEIVLNNAS